MTVEPDLISSRVKEVDEMNFWNLYSVRIISFEICVPFNSMLEDEQYLFLSLKRCQMYEFESKNLISNISY